MVGAVIGTAFNRPYKQDEWLRLFASRDTGCVKAGLLTAKVTRERTRGVGCASLWVHIVNRTNVDLGWDSADDGSLQLGTVLLT